MKEVLAGKVLNVIIQFCEITKTVYICKKSKMNKEHYEYVASNIGNKKLLYSFFSVGQQGIIEKVVAFQEMAPLTYNRVANPFYSL